MSSNTLNVKIQEAYDTETNWSSKNPVLLKGQIAISSDKNGMYKVGDGTSTWSALSYNTANTANSATSATSATKLSTARTIQTNLASTSTASFDGSANITPGVTGTLPVANGGTGATTAAGALSNLGLTATASELNYCDGVTSNIQTQIDSLNSNILLQVYPVGSIYLSINDTNPSTLFGGTWEAWGSGRMPIGVNSDDSDFSTVEKTGGEKTHTLTVSEMPSHEHTVNSHNHEIPELSGKAKSSGEHSHSVMAHSHIVPATSCTVGNGGGHSHNVYTRNGNFEAGTSGKATINVNTTSGNNEGRTTSHTGHTHGVTFPQTNTTNATPNTDPRGTHIHDVTTIKGTSGNASPGTNSSGEGTAHNNMPPFITCYMWKRIS